MGDSIDPMDMEEVSEKRLAERKQRLKEKPFLDQAESNEFDCIDDELYRRAREERS